MPDIACQTLLAGLEKLLGPAIVQVLRDPLAASESSEMLSSPRRPSSTILIFSPAEYRLRVARRIDQPGRFGKSKGVDAHFGLTPKQYQFGEIDRTGRISKLGDVILCTELFDAANVMLCRMVRFSARRHGRCGSLAGTV